MSRPWCAGLGRSSRARSPTRSSATWTGLPTLLAVAGEPDIKEKLQGGPQVRRQDFKVHLDGYNLLAVFTGEVEEESAHRVLLFL